MMCGALTVNMKNFAFFAVTLCFLQSALSSSAANTNQCPDKANTCQCLHQGAGASGANNDDIDVDTSDADSRTVGLAAATGTLAGVLATGTAMAAYFHFRGSPGGGGGFGGGGGGGGGGGNLPMHSSGGPRMQRTESVASSSGESYESQSPLTKSDRREKLSGLESRGRPFTGSSSSSNATNIYRHAKVWPGRF